MKAIVFGKQHQDRYIDRIASLLDLLIEHDVEVRLDPTFAKYVGALRPDAGPYEVAGDAYSPDVALSIGGDGTFLTAAQWVGDRDIPIVGINSGHLGYLTTADISQSEDIVRDLLEQNYQVEQRTVLAVSGSNGGRFDFGGYYAVNEVAFLRKDTSSMITMHSRLNDADLALIEGDGLIVCTPTGSTAYNMSVGGPIIEPTSACLCVAPISPHSLSMRPIVIRDDAVVSVTTVSRATQFQVSIDGRTIACPSGTTIQIRKAPFTVKVILSRQHNFATTLHDKLRWGVSTR